MVYVAVLSFHCPFNEDRLLHLHLSALFYLGCVSPLDVLFVSVALTSFDFMTLHLQSAKSKYSTSEVLKPGMLCFLRPDLRCIHWHPRTKSYYTVFSPLFWAALSQSASLCVDNNPLRVCCQSFPEMFVFICLLTAIWHSISLVVKCTNEPRCFLCFTRQLCKAVSSQAVMFSEYLTMFVLGLTVSSRQGIHQWDFLQKNVNCYLVMLHHLPIVEDFTVNLSGPEIQATLKHFNNYYCLVVDYSRLFFFNH